MSASNSLRKVDKLMHIWRKSSSFPVKNRSNHGSPALGAPAPARRSQEPLGGATGAARSTAKPQDTTYFQLPTCRILRKNACFEWLRHRIPCKNAYFQLPWYRIPSKNAHFLACFPASSCLLPLACFFFFFFLASSYLLFLACLLARSLAGFLLLATTLEFR